ncbi:MAG: F0F1 ATP synthase subunit B [Planctomycetota bacterium]
MNVSALGILLAEEGASPVQVVPDTLLFSLVVFLAMLAVLYYFAWGPIADGLEKREKNMADDIEGAKAANEQAQAQLKAYESKLAGAQDEAAALIAEAKNDALAAKERILAEAAEEAQRTKDRALADIEAAKNAAVRELAESSVDSAVSLAGNIVGRSLNKDDHSELIEKSIQQFNAG